MWYSIFVYKNETIREVNSYAQFNLFAGRDAELSVGSGSKVGIQIDPSLLS